MKVSNKDVLITGLVILLICMMFTLPRNNYTDQNGSKSCYIPNPEIDGPTLFTKPLMVRALTDEQCEALND